MNWSSDDAVTTAATVQRGNISLSWKLTAHCPGTVGSIGTGTPLFTGTVKKAWQTMRKQIDRAVQLQEGTRSLAGVPFAVKTYLTLLD